MNQKEFEVYKKKHAFCNKCGNLTTIRNMGGKYNQETGRAIKLKFYIYCFDYLPRTGHFAEYKTVEYI